MAVWLGQTPAGNGWRYMHEDGRVEDIDGAELPPGFVPPGFEGSTPSYADATQTGAPATEPAAPVLQPPVDPGLGVAPLEQPQVAPPVAPVAPQPAPASQSSAVSSSWRGATMGVDGAPGASGRLNQRADAEARRQTALYAPSVQAQRAATQGIVESQALAGEAQAQGFEREAAMLRDHQEARAREVMEIDQRSQRWTADLREAIDSVPTVDSRKIFHDQTSHQETAMAIGAFMGGFLQPVLGTNTPMDIINKAVDRSVADQQAAAEQAQRRVWNLKDLAAQDREAALWQLNESNIGRLTHLTALQRDVQAKVQSFQSDVMRRQGEKLLADLDKSVVDTYQQIYTQTRGFLEGQRHNMRMESIQSQELAMRKAEAEARARAAAGAAAKEQANLHLTKPTGLRTTTNGVKADGWTATSEKEREAVAKKAAETNTRWVGVKRLEKLVDKWDRLNLPNDEVRNRLVAMSAGMTIADLKPGMGSEKDAEKLTARYGGDFNTFIRMAPPEVIKKVLADTLDATSRDMQDFTATLSRDEGTRVTWENPELPDEVEETGPSAGTGIMRVKAAVQGNRPDELQGGLRDIAAELETYPGLAATPDGRAQVESWLGTVSSMPEQLRTFMGPDGQVVDIKDILTRSLVRGDQEKQFTDLESEANQKYPRETRPLGGY
jgi:esterase/lipase